MMRNLPQNFEKKGTTTLFLTNVAKSNLMVPKTTSWDQVQLLERWVLQRASALVKIENKFQIEM